MSLPIPDDETGVAGSSDTVAQQLAALVARVSILETELARLRSARQSSAQQSSPAPASRLDTSAEVGRVAPPPVPAACAVPPRPPESDLTRAVTVPRLGSKNLTQDRNALEMKVGATIFNRIAIVALLIAVALGLKLAVDHGWLVPSPTMRLILGLLGGAGLVLWSERFRSKGFAAFSYSLKAVGTGVLYLSLWASVQLYHLLPPAIALGAMVLVTAWNAWMAITQDSELLAAYALAGSLATPILLSSGQNHEAFLFTYLLSVLVAVAALQWKKPWPRLSLAALAGATAYFIGWYSIYWAASAMALTLSFALAMFAALAVVPLIAVSRSAIMEALLPLGSAAFGSLTIYSVLEDSRHQDLLPWGSLLFAALYLGLMRLRSGLLAAVHLSLAVTFLTVAIPLRLSGRWLVLAWCVEGVLLLWLSARTPESEQGQSRDDQIVVLKTLRGLALVSLALGVSGAFLLPFSIGSFSNFSVRPVLNATFLTQLAALAAMLATAWIANRADHPNAESETTRRTLRATQISWQGIAATAVIVFNLLALVAGMREIANAWHYGKISLTDAAILGESLSISAFLMAYGTALLAAGFWRRSPFIRWQGLVLLIVSIGKTFLYDLRDLSEGYRVASFVALGVLLMAISFAYQKDWLHLREPEADAGAREVDA